MTHDNVRKESSGDGAHGPVLPYRSLTFVPIPIPVPVPVQFRETPPSSPPAP
ncbi:unnamed protein product [Penicillium camemberti]|uniref:Str. FM013 n=1 Tax=Penicillium camemberti (strain FM 013) TaxID=1429867 RepID=A0A0G4PRP4_PENC3|nr:unnamed protein product [Penicillium camemberti]